MREVYADTRSPSIVVNHLFFRAGRASMTCACVILTVICAPSGVAQADGALRLEYVIHAGDQLTVAVLGIDSLSQGATVLSDGTIEYPIAGTVRVAGQTPAAAAALLSARLSRYVLHPIVTVSVAKPSNINVLVLGNVGKPGRYSLESESHISDALAAAGGIGTTNGDPPDARLSSTDGTAKNVSLRQLLYVGDIQLDLPLQGGDVLYVPSPTTFQVDILGAVDRPGTLDIRDGDRLSSAIARAGVGVNSQADLNRVQVTRGASGPAPSTFTVNLYKTLESGDLSRDFALQKGDLVYVPTLRKGSLAGSSVSGAAYLLSALRVLFLGYR